MNSYSKLEARTHHPFSAESFFISISVRNGLGKEKRKKKKKVFIIHVKNELICSHA